MRRRALLASGLAVALGGCGRDLGTLGEPSPSPTRTGTPTFEPGGAFIEGPLWLRAVNGTTRDAVTFEETIERLACGARPTADGSACGAPGTTVHEGTLTAPGFDTGEDGSYSGTGVSLAFDDGEDRTTVPGPELAGQSGVVTEQGDYRVTVAAAGQRAVEGVRAHAGVRGIETALSLDGALLLEAETDPASGVFDSPGDEDRPT
jgi:hypothetical protein